MRIVMVGAEAGRLAKTGGLADAVWSLSLALRDSGDSVRIVLPRYGWIDVETTLRETASIDALETVGYRLFESKIDGVSIDLVDSPLFSERRGLYGPDSGSEYPDNALRFALLGHAARTVARRYDREHTIIHGHDWPSGVALALNADSPSFASVLTIHNGAYLGTFAKHDAHYTHVPPARFEPDRARLRDSPTIGFLQAGLLAADRVTTVSARYAAELLSGGAAGDPLRYLERSRLRGIINGVDYRVWDPNRDPLIPARYDPADMSGKRVCKAELQRLARLPVESAIPVVGMIARLVEQKGLEELCFPDGGALVRICRQNVQVVILGEGSKRYEAVLARLAAAHRNLSVFIDFDERLAHLIEAGSDFFLMPSRFEPCGLNQLYSLRYGTTPIVHATGGLADTVVDIRQDSSRGTGWTYRKQTARAIARTVSAAIRWAARNPRRHHMMVQRGMTVDFSWKRAAAEYREVYRGALGAARRRR